MKIPFALIFASLWPVVSFAQIAGGEALSGQLKKARNENRLADIPAICDKILAGDVVGEFIANDRFLLSFATDSLAETGELAERMERWTEELTADPKSERLNCLLLVASLSLKGVETKQDGWVGYYAPINLRLRREGTRFTAEVWEQSGYWGKVGSYQVAMPRRILVGFAGSSQIAKFKEPLISVDGKSVPDGPWKQAHIGRTSTRGSFRETDGHLELIGWGEPIEKKWNEDIFFAYREVEGDVTIEVVLESKSRGEFGSSAGIMMRASLEPGAPFMSLALKEVSIVSFTRRVPSEAGKYLAALCDSRPGDPVFVSACLKAMHDFSMHEQARIAADRLLAAKPDPQALDEELLKDIYSHSGLKSPLVKARIEKPVPKDPEGRAKLAQTLRETAARAVDEGRFDEVVEDLRKCRELVSERDMPFEDSLTLIASLRQLGQPEEVDKELNRLFLGSSASGRAGADFQSERILGEMQISYPCLTPNVMSAFRAAADHGVALKIAASLEKSRGGRESQAARRAIAAALRVAGNDPAVTASLKSGAYLKSLPANLPDSARMLLAFQLQQTVGGRAAASQLLDSLIEKGGSGIGAGKVPLLLWKWKLDDLQGDSSAVADDVKRLAPLLGRDRSELPVTAKVVRFLLEAGDMAGARKLASGFPKREFPSPFDADSDANVLLDLYEGAPRPPIPAIWSVPDKDGIKVFWEYAPDNWHLQPIRETRARGKNVATQDGRYTLSIYAVRGEGLGPEVSEEDLLVRLPAAASSGSWFGPMPKDRQWLKAVVRNEKGGTQFAPSVSAAVGRNLLEPFNGDQLAAGNGVWSTVSKWYWTAPLGGGFPDNAWTVSRLTTARGFLLLTHKPVPIDPAAEYVLQGWVRSDGSGAVALACAFLDAEEREISYVKENATIEDRWTLVRYHLAPTNRGGRIMIPPGAKSLRVGFLVGCQGDFGDVGLYRVGHRAN